ncbi:putative replication restart DNA helicase PriA [Magnetofaba australis IT-1]|uniref:Replication restart protein PriA n=2 Tax=Magnetofaba TaxID=1472292 RepID=A0A1Y2K9J3_9PROT|nr:putative replication restart DNA helicase PriA [Magnetofaba australis IT-1]
MYAQVAIKGPYGGLFSYTIPDALREAAIPGALALVPMGRGNRTGLIWSLADTCDYTGEIKPLADILGDTPPLNAELMRLLDYIARYYRQAPASIAAAALPAHLLHDRKRRVIWLGETAPPDSLSPALRALADHLRKRKNGLMESTIAQHVGRAGLDRKLKLLRDDGLIRIEESWDARHKARENPHWEAEEQAEVRQLHEPPQLTDEQQEAVDALNEAITAGRFAPFLLQGVTGSGKTEVYFRAVETALAQGRQALLLVPEISLTPQLTARYRVRFHETLAVFHSGLTPARRHDEWRRARSGQARVIIGARSALFAPFADLGLIVVDEEHDGSYKQEEGVPYHARDMAIVRASFNQAVVVLGSATPAMESLHNAQHGKYHHLRLTQRATGADLPPIELVDLSDPQNREGMRAHSLIGKTLREAMSETLAAGKQSLLFLNRRGFAPALLCNLCGHSVSCPNCAVALTLHKGRNQLMCHYCDHVADPPDVCPECGQLGLIRFGPGTERLEEEVKQRFPDANVARLDRDAVKGSADRLAKTLDAFRSGAVDILVGTQMIAKGHHFSGLSLVGVIAAESAMSQPDFRAAERAFQLVTQVAGRAGRERGQTGRVLVQTFDPQHYALTAAACHDADLFADQELRFRAEAEYPPFSRMALVRFSCEDLGEGDRFVAELRRNLPHTEGALVLGPAPAPLSKLRGRHRWQLMIKGADIRMVHQAVGRILAAAEPLAGRNLRIGVDIDPQAFV